MIAQYTYSQVTGLCQLVSLAGMGLAAVLCVIGALAGANRSHDRLKNVMFALAGCCAGAGVVGMFLLQTVQQLPVTTVVDQAAMLKDNTHFQKWTDLSQMFVFVNWTAVRQAVFGLLIVLVPIIGMLMIAYRDRTEATGKVVLASLISIVIGMVMGSVIILISGLSAPTLGGKASWEGIQLIVGGLFSLPRNAAGELAFGFNAVSFGNMLFRATPLILTGLSVALANKTGLFNIGAPGQYLMGTAASLFIALSLPTGTGDMVKHYELLGMSPETFYPAWLVWTLAFLGGILAGAVWGAIPGMLKAALNINEVLACIMTNWIAANVVTYVFDISNLKNIVETTKTSYIYKTSFNGVETSKLGLDSLLPGSQVNGGFVIAVLMAVVVYLVLNKTTFGFELKACGSNRFAARYAGIRDKRGIVISMAIAGGIAGAAGALYQLAGNTEFFWATYQTLPAVGFNGIPVALLAANNPIGVVFSGLFMSMLEICGVQLRYLTGFNEYITQVIVAVIVYLSAFAMIFRMLLSSRGKKNGKEAAKK